MESNENSFSLVDREKIAMMDQGYKSDNDKINF